MPLPVPERNVDDSPARPLACTLPTRPSFGSAPSCVHPKVHLAIGASPSYLVRLFGLFDRGETSYQRGLAFPSMQRIALTRLFGIKRLLDIGQEIHGTSPWCGHTGIFVIITERSQPVVVQDLGRSRSVRRIDRQTTLDKRLGLRRDAFPVLGLQQMNRKR